MADISGRPRTTWRCRLLGHAWVYRAADDSEVCPRAGCVFMRRIGDWYPSPDRRNGVDPPPKPC